MGMGGGEFDQICASSKQDFMVKGKQLMVTEQSRDWDLNEWKWDSNLFIAKPLNSRPSNHRNQFFLNESPDSDGIVQNNRSSEKRRKVLMVEEEELEQGDDASLTLKLGGAVYMDAEREGGDGKNGKRLKPQLVLSNRPLCQVDDCNADLSDARDYHRRHKVCEMHAKSPMVRLRGDAQRFCQQCSRFHMLQEFDEGKKSCRRRLAGHNRRRRRTNLDAIIGGHSLNDDHAKSYILVCLLRILSNLHSNNSDQTKDQDLLYKLLGMLAGSGDTSARTELPVHVESPQPLKHGMPSIPSSSLCGIAALEPLGGPCSTIAGSSHISSQDTSARIVDPSSSANLTMTWTPQKLPPQISLNGVKGLCPTKDYPRRGSDVERGQIHAVETGCTWERTNLNAKLNDFDLNSICTESQDNPSRQYQDIHHGNPLQTSADSESASDKSPSRPSGNFSCRTERIVFKLFGKDPSNLPHVLRAQILNWLQHSPTDIESYIRPGCIVLTIYLRLSEKMWEELCKNLRSQLERLLEVSGDNFWRSGWICTKVENQLAFIHSGQVLLDTSVHLRSQKAPTILSVTPVAAPLSTEAIFTVRGMHLTCTTTKLICAFQGRQLVQEIEPDSKGDNGSSTDSFEYLSEGQREIQCYTFTCSLPNVAGRGFIEVEDHDLSSGFLPFIIAENDVCSELRSLEAWIGIIEPLPDQMKQRDHVIEFLQEFGWLLERSRLLFSGSDLSNQPAPHFSYFRFKWLFEFSIEHDWCAVVKKLLTVLFDGVVDCSVKQLLEEVGPLHRAVRRNCGPMVDSLLKYNPKGRAITQTNPQAELCKPIFKVDMRGPAGITPLHIAASIEGADIVLDRLTEDSEQNWVHTWEHGRDESGFTPQDYAKQRGHDRYVELVRRKISEKSSGRNLILDMTNPLSSGERVGESSLTMQEDTSKYKDKSAALQIDTSAGCKLCAQKLVYGSRHRSLRYYRPAILSMVTIACVCVCVGLFLKSPPEVGFLDRPFSWDMLDYGPI